MSEPIGFVASEQVRPVVPRGYGGSMRSGRSPVTRWHAAEQVSDLGAEGAITSDVRYDAVEQLVHERKRRG